MQEFVDDTSVQKEVLKRWIDRHLKENSTKRYSYKRISYKITQEHVNFLVKKLEESR